MREGGCREGGQAWEGAEREGADRAGCRERPGVTDAHILSLFFCILYGFIQ